MALKSKGLGGYESKNNSNLYCLHHIRDVLKDNPHLEK